MKTTIQVLLVIFAFAFFSCQKQSDVITTDESASLLKSATIAVNDVAVESVAQEANSNKNSQDLTKCKTLTIIDFSVEYLECFRKNSILCASPESGLSFILLSKTSPIPKHELQPKQ